MILFDEIEKAHPEVWNTLLQILDNGRLTDGQGRQVDFRNCVLIMTSNLGTEYVSRSGSLGFLDSSASDTDIEARDKINKALKDAFRPEFLNRIDEIITFSPLSEKDMVKIVNLKLQEVTQRLIENGLKVSLTKKAHLWLAKNGYTADFGARPLIRALQKFIESPLSKKLLEGEFKTGDTVVADLDPETEDKLVFTKK